MKHLCSDSLLKCKMKDKIFDSFMDNYYWELLLKKAGVSGLNCKSFLEYLVDVFLTFKGFTVAQNVRNQISEKS